jgi:arginine N-succinyltransferase
LVLEEENRVIGTAGIFTNLGSERPFYSYRISQITRESPELDIRSDVKILSLVNDYQGYSEIGTLFLDPAWRGGGRGRLMSFSRFMLMAAHQDRFNTNVLAEIRGWSDSDERFPFWEAIGQKFFKMGFVEADKRSTVDTRFIADLMPKHPIYVSLLSEEAQRIIGEPHTLSRPAMELLESQGFRYRNCVDILDAGPSIEAVVSEVETVRNSFMATVAIDDAALGSDGEKWLVANPALDNFSCTETQLAKGVEVGNGGSMPLSVAQAKSLNVVASRSGIRSYCRQVEH